MRGMDVDTGRSVEDLAHLRQSVRDILTTPIGSRVMLRDYGSDLFRLIDHPVNGDFSLDIFAAVITALWRWEPRIEVRRVSLAAAQVGRVILDIDGLYRPDGRPVTLAGIVVR
ncbi:MAG: GPW/gp25 family protein [Alphaproteobacteria bacterium]|nr:GPW/gp25 family protein [Alphaproteobacteria bacterium]